MIYQIAPMVTTAILQSLLLAGICYATFGLLLAPMKHIDPLLKYHAGNIILLVSFISFIQPLYTITEPTDAAPVHSVSLPATDTKTVNVLPYVMQETAALPESRLTSEQVWQHVNNTLEENSNTILLLYLAGLLFFSARLLVQYLKSRWLKTKNTLPTSDTWQTLLKQTKEQLNITANISIAFTKRNISPCIIGHAKAIILIPVAIANNLSTEQAESILLHELAHYKHYDHYINLATQCINCLMFFNPFVWLISKQCDKYRELACDATAKKHNRSIELAETLALIAGMYTRKNSMALSLKKQSPLLGRIQALLNVQPSAKTSQKPLSYILASIMLVTGILLVGSSDLFSKEHDNTREKLQRISKEMYEAGNEKYIFVDAVLDSIIKLPSKAEMLYMGPQYFAFESSQGPVKPEGSLKEKYLAKLQRFLVAQGETKYTVVEFKVGDGRKAFDIDHIYSEQFQQVSLRDHFDAGITSQAWAEIFNHIMDDNMPLYTNDDYELNYGPDGININGNQLTGEQEKKYRRLFREKFGIDLAKDKLSGRMNLYGLRSRHIEHNKAATPLQNEFAAISQILFNEGKIEYLVADAVKDGYLADGERFTLSFGDSIARFAGKRFSKQDEKAYDAKYKKFREYYVGRDCYGIITKTVHFTDIRNPRSDFMNGEFLFKERQQKRSKILSNIYKELRQDKLIDTNYRTEIDYRAKDGLFLNYEPFKASLTEKYMKMFRQIERDLDINSKTARFSYTWKIDKPFPQFYYDRMSSFITKDLLRNTSKTMYKDDDTKYIVADALADGILKEGERYDIAYKNGIVTIRNKTLTAEQQNEYNSKYVSFVQIHHPSVNYSGAIKGTVNVNDIINRQSSYSRDNIPGLVPGTTDTYSDHVINEMAKEGLIDTNYSVRVEYSPKGLYINDKKQSGSIVKKYGTIFQHSDPALGISKKTSILWTPNKSDAGKNRVSEDDALRILSDRMFATGNQSFAIVDAIRDGYIEQDKPYEISYREGKFSVKGKDIPTDIRTRYERRLEKFRSIYGDSVNMWGTISSTLHRTVREDEFSKQFGIMLPKPTKAERAKYEESKKQYEKNKKQYEENKRNNTVLDEMVQAMLRDGLLDTTSYYRISYMEDGLYVNNQHITGSGAKHYEQILKELGYKPGGTTNGIIRESRFDNSPIPEWARSTTSFDTNSKLPHDAATFDDPVSSTGQTKSTAYLDKVIKMMAADGLVDTTKKHTLKYNSRGIFVNGKKLSKEKAARYEPTLEAGFGHKPHSIAGDELKYSYEP